MIRKEKNNLEKNSKWKSRDSNLFLYLFFFVFWKFVASLFIRFWFLFFKGIYASVVHNMFDLVIQQHTVCTSEWDTYFSIQNTIIKKRIYSKENVNEHMNDSIQCLIERTRERLMWNVQIILLPSYFVSFHICLDGISRKGDCFLVNRYDEIRINKFQIGEKFLSIFFIFCLHAIKHEWNIILYYRYYNNCKLTYLYNSSVHVGHI